MKFVHSLLFGLVVILSVFFTSCRKENTYLEDGGIVTFSTDTIFFDTVFTALKSSTRIVKVYNSENTAIRVNVQLKELDNSSFRINVDGKLGVKADEIKILANDSATIFINALIDSTSEDTAFVIEDALQVKVNQNNFEIPIIAFAQNAHYIYDSVLSTTTFTKDRPYVIIKSALVEEGATLTVEPGTKIYMHRNSRLFVQGTLRIEGTLEEPIIIQSDRIDRDIYVGSDNDMAGEWGGIYFLDVSHDNLINYAIIKNGGLSTQVGTSTTLPAMIQVDKDISGSSTPKLTITNSIIKNAIQYGILSFGGSIYAENCVIVNSQKIALALLEGGDYTFNDCTIGIFGGIPLFSRSSESAAVLAQNYYETAPGTFIGKALNLTFNNCIISGNFENEFYTNIIPDYPATIHLNTCLVQRVEAFDAYVNRTDCIYNVSPQFIDYTKSDFHLNISSPLIGKGILVGTTNKDLDGIDRLSPTSIGAYEYQEGQ